MTGFLKRAIAPRGLGLSFLLVLIPYCCRVDNAFTWMLDSQGVLFLFMFAFCAGAALCSIAVALSPLGSASQQALWVVAASVCCVAGIVAAGCISLVSPRACAVASGMLIGFGLVAAMRQWWAVYAPLRVDTLLTTAGITLFITAFIWYVLQLTPNFFITCFCLVMCVLCSGLLCIAFLLVDARRDRVEPDGQPASSLDEELPRELARTIGLDEAEQMRFPRWIAGAALFALFYSFFTLGLTFYPESAGVSSSVVMFKPAPYALVLVGLAVCLYLESSRGPLPVTTSSLALAVAGAVLLVSPFLEDVVDLQSIPLAPAYTGVALFFLYGFASPLLLSHGRRAGVERYFALASFGSVASLALGVLVFWGIGEGGQIVSLCLMAAYLALLVAASVWDNVRARKVLDNALSAARRHAAEEAANGGATGEEDADASQRAEGTPAGSPEQDGGPAEASLNAQPADPRRSACERIAEKYQLSAREAEVLWLLARGYGARYIANRLYISADTVRTHCKRIYEKANVHSKEELIELIEATETIENATARLAALADAASVASPDPPPADEGAAADTPAPEGADAEGAGADSSEG